MTLSKKRSHSFIVRIWGEPREIKGAPLQWRGMIEHVATHQRYYVKELDEFVAIIASYLAQMGTEPSSEDEPDEIDPLSDHQI